MHTGAFYAFYAFYAWWIHFPQSGALAEGTSRTAQTIHTSGNHKPALARVSACRAVLKHQAIKVF
jgi:hypothetical protein